MPDSLVKQIENDLATITSDLRDIDCMSITTLMSRTLGCIKHFLERELIREQMIEHELAREQAIEILEGENK